jgi:hypothetical protein
MKIERCLLKLPRRSCDVVAVIYGEPERVVEVPRELFGAILTSRFLTVTR